MARHLAREEDDAVTLVRVYCGLASADPAPRPAPAASRLTVAVVDDAGRLLDICEIGDEPAGYARLAALFVERSSGSSGVAIAVDSDDHLVTSLLTAAGRPMAVADDDATDDYAERFADDDSVEEMNSPPATRRAIGLARALQAGAMSAVTLPAPRDLHGYKPMLAAHAALSNGRHAAATALREVLRELYPAALRAYPDPAQPIPLAVLDALPEAGRLAGAAGRGREMADAVDAVVAELAADSAADEAALREAVTALHVAITESPRRAGANRSLTTAVAEAVRQAVAAVRACDAACDALVDTLSARVTTPPMGRRSALRQSAAPAPVGLPGNRPAVEPAPTRAGRRSRQEPAAASSMPVTPRPLTAPPVAPEPVTPPPVAPHPITSRPAASVAATEPVSASPSSRPVSAPPPPPPGITPILPTPRNTVPPADAGKPFRPTITAAAISNARADRQRTVIPPRVNTRTPADAPSNTSGFNPTGFAATDVSVPVPSTRPTAETPPPGSRGNWPLAAPADERDQEPGFPRGRSALDDPPAPAAPGPSDGRVRPPWQSDDLPAEPPALRLVEPPPLADRTLRDDAGRSERLEMPPLRLVDSDDTGRSPRSTRHGTTALDRSAPPVSDEGDGDLLIFAAARSAWFTGQDEAEGDREWSTSADSGWQAAEQAARPAVGAETSAGLPKRVPQANLVPGSPLREERPLRIVRDAASIAAHTTGYFRGWRRGQEIGGYAIGGRPGRESAGGWDFTRDGGDREDDREYEYRPVGHRR